MIKLLYNKSDQRYIFFTGNISELKLIEKHFNQIPSYMFMPSFSGVPRPVEFFRKFRHDSGQNIFYCHSGLWKTIADWCEEKGIKIEIPENFNEFKYTRFKDSLEEFTEYIKTWNLTLNPYDYQIKAAWLILHYKQSLSQLATRAGKTLIAYIVFRYAMEKLGVKKILMIVPSTYLVKQAVGDFDDYKEYFLSETVWADGELCAGSNLTIGTFQSLVKRADKKSVKYDPKFFQDYDLVLVDEAHTLKCDSINTILNQSFLKNVKIKFGFTGTLPEEHTIDSFCCHSLMGPTIQDIRSRELMDAGFITPIDITQIIIKHPWSKELKQQYIKCGEYLNGIPQEKVEWIGGKKHKSRMLLPQDQREFTLVEQKKLPLVLHSMKYSTEYDEDSYINYLIDMCKAKGSNLLMLEQMLVHRDQKRLDIIQELLFGLDKNCIVFAHHTEYLRFLYNYYKRIFPDRPIYIITGQTSTKKRTDIINKMVTDQGAILFASYGCIGTGATFKNVDYGIFAQSFKSQIINRQSLGRGLCLASGKDKFYLYDLVDDFPTGMLKSQGKAKLKLYKEDKFDVCQVSK